jgi:hypothetical protein
MEVKKTHQRKFIVLGFTLLALFVAVAGASIVFQSPHVYAATPANYTIDALGEITQSFTVTSTVNGQTQTGACQTITHAVPITGSADPNTTLTIKAFSDANCTMPLTDQNQSPTLGGPGSNNTYTVE